MTIFSPEQAERVRLAFESSARQPNNGSVTKNGTKMPNGGGRTSAPSTHPDTWEHTLPMAKDPALLDLCEGATAQPPSLSAHIRVGRF